MRFLTSEERDGLDAANARAWREAERGWAGRPLASSYHKLTWFEHDPEAYRVGKPFPGRVLDRLISDANHERWVTRLWHRMCRLECAKK